MAATMLTTYLAACALALRPWRAIALACGALVAVVVVVLTNAFLLAPLTEDVAPTSRRLPPRATYWDLPTGSRIAVRKVEGRGGAQALPIVFLHGGPGAYSVALAPTVEALSALADEGHDIYFYDQVGGGLSARLEDVTAYSLDRHVADLEAIYRRLGGD